MHSFQPSRGRIFFEVLCALTVAGSLAGAWQQTGATALLPAAAAMALFGLSHLFDMRRPKPAVTVEPQRVDFAPDEQGEVVAQLDAEIAPVADAPVEEPETAEATAARSESGRRKGGSRKGTGRRASAPKPVELIELAPAEEPAVVEPVPAEEPVPSEPIPMEEDEAVEFGEPVAHLSHAPLFEPDPYVRMQRPAFGRRGRL